MAKKSVVVSIVVRRRDIMSNIFIKLSYFVTLTGLILMCYFDIYHNGWLWDKIFLVFVIMMIFIGALVLFVIGWLSEPPPSKSRRKTKTNEKWRPLP